MLKQSLFHDMQHWHAVHLLIVCKCKSIRKTHPCNILYRNFRAVKIENFQMIFFQIRIIAKNIAA